MSGREPIAFSEFFAAWSGRSRDEFLGEVTCPYLVLPKVEGRPVPDDTVTGRVDPAHTIAVWDMQSLLPVVGEGDRLTLGRAPTCDVVVNDGRLSRVQATLERNPDGEWLISDAGSTNGTRVNLERVPAHRGVPLTAGARIRLAEAIDLVFLTPEALFGVVERVQRAGAGRA